VGMARIATSAYFAAFGPLFFTKVALLDRLIFTDMVQNSRLSIQTQKIFTVLVSAKC
jgi:hypothetical protein